MDTEKSQIKVSCDWFALCDCVPSLRFVFAHAPRFLCQDLFNNVVTSISMKNFLNFRSYHVQCLSIEVSVSVCVGRNKYYVIK